jgi:two-component system, cell cycle response regulator
MTREDFDIEIALYTLNYAIRLLVSELDFDKLVNQIIETVADFASSKHVCLFEFDEETAELRLLNGYKKGRFLQPETKFELTAEVKACFNSKNPQRFALDFIEDIPYPKSGSTDQEKCICFPLIGAHNQVVGLMTLSCSAGKQIIETEMQILRIIMSLCSTSLEKARLFKQATVDGLTGLYTRRYFDVRLDEELHRIKYKGGEIFLLITDIDHFKNFNDTYGHQQGDIVLRELAGLVMNYKKEEMERIACRYGGEEFGIILINTNEKKAASFTEELRKVCEDHPFSGQKEPLKVNFSGGLSGASQKRILNAAEFIKRSDDLLYQAKEAGRNRIYEYGKEYRK